MDEQHKVHRVSESVHDALNAIRAGRFVIVLDDESRENEGDLSSRQNTQQPPRTAISPTEASSWRGSGSTFGR
jgi:3,4-dihydroxy-2-butanone 4-phosphate synthase